LASSPVSHNHWYSDNQGPFLYTEVTGDFVAEVDVRVGRRDDLSLAPRGSFASAGLLVRDPASATGQQRWVMYNVGHQGGGIAREAKTTRPGNGGASPSTLFLNTVIAGAGPTGKLRVCRVGSTLRFFHQHPGESDWIEEHFDAAATQVQPPGAGPTTPGVAGGLLRFERADLPATVQVGLMAGVWDAPLETLATYDDFRVRPTTDCN
jgi:hypothetical protein